MNVWWRQDITSWRSNCKHMWNTHEHNECEWLWFANSLVAQTKRMHSWPKKEKDQRNFWKQATDRMHFGQPERIQGRHSLIWTNYSVCNRTCGIERYTNIKLNKRLCSIDEWIEVEVENRVIIERSQQQQQQKQQIRLKIEFKAAELLTERVQVEIIAASWNTHTIKWWH